VTTFPSFAAARGSARSVEESRSSRMTCSMCCRSTTVKRLVLTSASSSELVIDRFPAPLMSAIATLWYGAMLISAGFITGTRTATVPQAQRMPAPSAPKTRFFMINFPKVLAQLARFHR